MCPNKFTTLLFQTYRSLGIPLTGRHDHFPSRRRLGLLFVALAHIFCLSIQGQPASSNLQGESSYSIAQSGPNQRVWKKVVARINLTGNVSYRTNAYVEIATGMNHLVGNQWVESSDDIQLTAFGGAATNTQHQVYFSANINYMGSISIITPSGANLSGTILGLSLYDSAQDKRVVIAQVQDSLGQVLPNMNQVVYTNALRDSRSDFSADVLYTHHLGQFEQDVVFHQQTPDPANLGLNPDTTVIQVWTEFVQGNDPHISTNQNMVLARLNGIWAKQLVTDETLDFEGMRMGLGVASATGSITNTPDGKGALLIPVSKHWLHKGTRRFLVEEVPFNAVVADLSLLPAPTSRVGSTNAQQSFFRSPSKARSVGSLVMAKKTSVVRDGLVLDYNLANTSVTNFTFQGDTTYLISGTANLYGVTTIEGGTVIKEMPSATLEVMENEVNWKTASYRPAIFTVTNDDSVGDIISGSTGTPTLAVDATFLYCLQGGQVHDARFSYAWNAYSGCLPDLEIRNCQFIDCDNVIVANSSTTNLSLHNVLITMTNTINNTANYCSCFPGAFVTFPYVMNIQAENLTADLGPSGYLVKNFNPVNPADCSVNLTNCIIITPNQAPYYVFGENSGVPVYTNYSYCAGSRPANLFQPVGAGGYYLTNGSIASGIGTTNIDTNTLADLRAKTTAPPAVYDRQYFTNAAGLSPQVARDTNASPDIGYHYDPLDYAFSYVGVTNLVLNVLPGTVIGGFIPLGYDEGCALRIGPGGQLFCVGSPTSMNRIVQYNTVQEQATSGWQVPDQGMLVPNSQTNGPASVLNIRFTDFSGLANEAMHIFTSGGNTQPVNVQDSQFHGGNIDISNEGINFVNCLFERTGVGIVFNTTSTDVIRNNLFFNGYLLAYGSSNVTAQDNLFYSTYISDVSAGGYTAGYNAYYNTTNTYLSVTNLTDKMLTSDPGFQKGPLGQYYLTTNSALIDAGSASAASLGLYHYTTQTNGTKEANSPVDISYHYVALDGSNLPIDTNGDGIPDYLADSNGNGYYDIADFARWNVMPIFSDTDQDGLSDWYEINVSHSDPNSPQSVPALTDRVINRCPEN